MFIKKGTCFRTWDFKISEITSAKNLKIESESEIGEAKEKIECKYKGAELEIGYNGNYLLSIFTKIDSGEVQLSFKDPLTAALITPAKQKEGEQITYLLMPIRLE